MEKTAPTALSKQQEQEEDGEKAELQTLVSDKEDFAALECSQDEDRITTLIKDAKISLERTSALGASREKAKGLKEVAPCSVDEGTSMNTEGKPTDETCSSKEDPSFLSPSPHQKSNDDLEACNMTGMF